MENNLKIHKSRAMTLTLVRRCSISNVSKIFSYTTYTMYSNFMFMDRLLIKLWYRWYIWEQEPYPELVEQYQCERNRKYRTKGQYQNQERTRTGTKNGNSTGTKNGMETKSGTGTKNGAQCSGV